MHASNLTRAVALVGPIATCAVLYAFRDSVPDVTAALLLVLWVVGAAATGDRVSGILAGVASGASFDFFLTQPYLRFTIDDSMDVQTVLLLVAISIAVSEIALWGRRHQARAARRAGYLDGVVEVARTVTDAEASKHTVIDIVCHQMVEILGVDEARYVDGPIYDERIARLDHDGVLTRHGRRVDVDRCGLPTDEYTAILVRRGTDVLGHFLLTATSHVTYPTAEQRRVAVVLADQVARQHTTPAS